MTGHWRLNPNHPTLPDVLPGTVGRLATRADIEFGNLVHLDDTEGNPVWAFRNTKKCRCGDEFCYYGETLMRRNPDIFEWVDPEPAPTWPGLDAVVSESSPKCYPNPHELMSHWVHVECNTAQERTRVFLAVRAVLAALGEGKTIWAGSSAFDPDDMKLIVRPDGERGK